METHQSSCEPMYLPSRHNCFATFLPLTLNLSPLYDYTCTWKVVKPQSEMLLYCPPHLPTNGYNIVSQIHLALETMNSRGH